MKNMSDNIRACSTMPAQKTARGWEKTYVFSASFPGFQGHFPQNPILPAILQLVTARESIAEQMGRDVLITGVKQAKFRRIVTPDTPITVIWTLNEKDDGLHSSCILETEGNPVSSFALTLTAKSD